MAKKITGIREDKNGRNTHVTVDGVTRPVGAVIQDINRGIAHRTDPPKGGGAPVHVVDGPTKPYLRTNPNNKSRDNLDNLPKK